jgi:hypothetical protein
MSTSMARRLIRPEGARRAGAGAEFALRHVGGADRPRRPALALPHPRPARLAATRHHGHDLRTRTRRTDQTRPTLGHSTSSHTDGHSIPARPASGLRGARSQPTTTLGGRDVAPARPSGAIPDMSTTARPTAASRMKAKAHIAAPQTTRVDEPGRVSLIGAYARNRLPKAGVTGAVARTPRRRLLRVFRALGGEYFLPPEREVTLEGGT